MSLSFGPSETELDSATVLEASRADVAVEACAVLDLKPLRGDVTVELRRASEKHLLTRRHRTLDVAAHSHAGGVDQRLDARARRDLDVAADPQLTFDAALHVDAAAERELALEAVTRAERELVLTITLGFGAVVFRAVVVVCGFCDRLLRIHAIPPEE